MIWPRHLSARLIGSGNFTPVTVERERPGEATSVNYIDFASPVTHR